MVLVCPVSGCGCPRRFFRYPMLEILEQHKGLCLWLMTVNKAYPFSSITSVTILNCWTVVWVILLTRFFLGTKYSVWQIFGAALCVVGLCLVVLFDSGVEGGGKNTSMKEIW